MVDYLARYARSEIARFARGGHNVRASYAGSCLELPNVTSRSEMNRKPSEHAVQPVENFWDGSEAPDALRSGFRCSGWEW